MVRTTKILNNAGMLTTEFKRCCQEYRTLSIAVAWSGNPRLMVPFSSIQEVRERVVATVGTDFNHTHPDAITWLTTAGAEVRIFREQPSVFHPKVYLFRSGTRYALIIGSSNLTHGGFSVNHEVNVLIEGDSTADTDQDILALEQQLGIWHNEPFSFAPTEQWLVRYRERYLTSKAKQEREGLWTPPLADAESRTGNWLRDASWEGYLASVLAGLDRHGRLEKEYHFVLDAAARELPIPWPPSICAELERRRVIGGLPPYAWLGHVSASGDFRRLLASGSIHEHSTMTTAINAIAALNPPIAWKELKRHLDSLVALRPTMKVWGRVLCLVRPDLYCTVSSESVRRNLSETLGIPRQRLLTPDGYIRLIQLLHGTPWFNSDCPADAGGRAIWSRRVTFLDALFHDESHV